MTIPSNQEKMINRLIRKATENIDLLCQMLELSTTPSYVPTVAIPVNDKMQIILNGNDREHKTVAVAHTGQGWVEVTYTDTGVEIYIHKESGTPVGAPIVVNKSELAD